jgi:hypothetical protein
VRDGQIFPPTLRRCLRPLSDTCSRDSDPHFAVMRKYIRNSPYMLPVTMVMLTAASWETIARRSLLMAQGTCTTAEYWRMGGEKAAAIRSSMAAIMSGRGHAAVLAPFVNRARADAKRLRRTA